MPRLRSAAVLGAGLLAVLAPAAAAKELQGASVCGADRCAAVPESELSYTLFEGRNMAAAPRRAEPFYRVRFRIGGGGHHETFTLVLLPRGGYIGGFEDFGGSPYEWLALGDNELTVYRGLTEALEPFPQRGAARLIGAHGGGDVGGGEAPSPSPAAPEPAAATPEEAGDEGGDGIAVAGIVAGVALIAIAGYSLRRRASAR